MSECRGQACDEAVAELGAVRACDEDVRGIAEGFADVSKRMYPSIVCCDFDSPGCDAGASYRFHLGQADVTQIVGLWADIFDTHDVVVEDADVPEAHTQ